MQLSRTWVACICMGHTYSKHWFILHLKFKCNGHPVFFWQPCTMVSCGLSEGKHCLTKRPPRLVLLPVFLPPALPPALPSSTRENTSKPVGPSPSSWPIPATLSASSASLVSQRVEGCPPSLHGSEWGAHPGGHVASPVATDGAHPPAQMNPSNHPWFHCRKRILAMPLSPACLSIRGHPKLLCRTCTTTVHQAGVIQCSRFSASFQEVRHQVWCARILTAPHKGSGRIWFTHVTFHTRDKRALLNQNLLSGSGYDF